MKIRDAFTRKTPTLSFEVFPPAREGNVESLYETIRELGDWKPDFISVTYGAGGSTRDKTIEIAAKVKKDFHHEVLAHLTCVQSTRDDIAGILDALKNETIENILALRGDPPDGTGVFRRIEGGFGYANELVEFIRSRSDFCVGVAGYPEGHCEAPSLDEDIRNLKRKIDAGADFIITQLFFDNDDFYRFRERVMKCGVRVPIVPGIFPILNYKQSQRIGSLCAPKLPPALREKIEKYRDKPEEIEKYGIEHAARQSEHLLQNEAAGIHIYSMNRSGPVRRILAELPLDPARRASKKG
ncbi:MAG TPA: methylenetetrahydrofolate reductase [NAD(P)H] [Syntrophales bacterium]|nr:methylenetetrahydrofolate reductase [NAD(P)H] [Syntrophales bacterium]